MVFECCHLPPWCHSSSRAVALANGSQETTSKTASKPTKNCLLMESRSEWHTHTTFTHAHTDTNTQILWLQSPICLWCLLTSPFYEVQKKFYTGQDLVWIGLNCAFGWTKANSAKGRMRKKKTQRCYWENATRAEAWGFKVWGSWGYSEENRQSWASKAGDGVDLVVDGDTLKLSILEHLSFFLSMFPFLEQWLLDGPQKQTLKGGDISSELFMLVNPAVVRYNHKETEGATEFKTQQISHFIWFIVGSNYFTYITCCMKRDYFHWHYIQIVFSAGV